MRGTQREGQQSNYAYVAKVAAGAEIEATAKGYKRSSSIGRLRCALICIGTGGASEGEYDSNSAFLKADCDTSPRPVDDGVSCFIGTWRLGVGAAISSSKKASSPMNLGRFGGSTAPWLLSEIVRRTVRGGVIPPAVVSICPTSADLFKVTLGARKRCCGCISSKRAGG